MMTVHVLHAGDGYTYLTRQVASGDVTRGRGESLSDYYVHDGNPPGRWVGEGLADLQVSGLVTEEQMRALFGEGRHPDADRIERELVVAGAGVDEALKATRLGRRFPRFDAPDDDPYESRLRGAFDQFRVDHDRSPEPGVERDLIRWNVARSVLADSPGESVPTDADVARFLAGRGSAQRQPVAGYDFVFTPVKSVSTLWALGDDQTRVAVQQAHETAWRRTVRWLESEAALTRVGAGGVAQVGTRGFVATAFDHLDSRTGDPNLHTHVAVSTKVQGSDGKWRSLDGRVLHALGVAASERYNTMIETELRARLGVGFVAETRARGGQPVREIRGIGAEVRAAFSGRRAQIERAYEELVGQYRAQHGHEPPKPAQFKFAQQATLATRQTKDEIVSLTTRRAQWRARAEAVLGSGRAVDAMVREALNPSPVEPELGANVTVAELTDQVLAALSESRSVWAVGNIQAEAQRVARTAGASIDGLDLVDLGDALTQEVLHRSVPLNPPDMLPVPQALRRVDGESVYLEHATQRFTSVQLLQAEDRLLGAAQQVGGLVVEADTLDAAIDQMETRTGQVLNDGQRNLTRRFGAGGHVLEAGIGPAGAGKTTAMAAFARAVRMAGGHVLGLAPSAAAAAVLGEELGVEAETLHKLLHAHAGDAEVTGYLTLDERTVLLVDEAGMAGTPELDRLLTLANRYGAAVRLLGDPAQLQAVGAGGVLRLIDTHVGAAHLELVHRFTVPGEADASLRVREGHSDGLDFYIDHARCSGGTREAMTEDLYAAWWADATAGMDSVMIAATNDDVMRLCMRARMDRVTEGIVEAGGVQLHDESIAGVGDVVVTRANARSLRVERGTDFVKNGDLWHVVERHDDGALRLRHTVHHGFITVPADYVAENVELGYAATVHRVQGMTVDTAHYLLTGGATRGHLYTGLTRGRLNNKVYVVTDELLDVDLHSQPTPARAVRDCLRAVLDRSSTAPSATTALDEEWSRASSLARLVPQYEDAYLRVLDPDCEDRMAAAVLTGLGETTGRAVLDEDAWSALRARLAAHELAGADVVDLIRTQVADRELGSADSVARVLHHRIGLAPAAADHRGLPSWILRAPDTVPWLTPTPTAAETPPQDVPAEAPASAERQMVVAINEAAWSWWTEQSGGADDWTGDYLTERALTGLEAAYAPRGWTSVLDGLTEQGYTRDQLLTAGLVTVSGRGTLIDRFRDRLVIPIRNLDGDLVAFTARRSPAEVREDVPKYLNSPETPAYSKRAVLLGLDPDARQRLAAGARPVLVEGPMDMAAMRIAAPHLVPVAACGTSVTTEHLAQLRQTTPGGLADLIVALDPDTAGQKAAVRVWSMLDPAEAAGARTVSLPDGVDPAQLVQDGRADELRRAVDEPQPLTHVVIDTIVNDVRLDHVEGRVAAVRQVAAAVAQLPTAAVAEATTYLTGRMGDRLDALTVADEIIGAHLDAHTPQLEPTPASAPTPTVDPDVRAWVQGQADLIAARLDALVDHAQTHRPGWTRHLLDAPTDPGEAQQWRAQVRRIVAYRDRYDITTDEPVPARRADGAQEAARSDAYDAYRHLRQEQPAGEPADGADDDRARRRTATASRVGELLDRVQQTQRPPANETLADRARRLAAQRQSRGASPDEPTRGPGQPGPQM